MPPMGPHDLSYRDYVEAIYRDPPHMLMLIANIGIFAGAAWLPGPAAAGEPAS